jgi:hypothetical protein
MLSLMLIKMNQCIAEPCASNTDVYFFCRLKINHMMGLEVLAFNYELGVVTKRIV